MADVICLNNLKGISNELCDNSNPLTILSGIALTAPDFEFSSLTNFATQAQWLTAIANKEIFPIQGVEEQEFFGTEDNVADTGSGNKVFIREGKRGKKLMFLMNPDMHKILRTYSQKKMRLIKFDQNNNVIGTSPDGTVVKGVKLSYLRVSKMQDPSNDAPAYSVLEYMEQDVNEMDSKMVVFTPSWLTSDLTGVLTVVITPSTMAANVFTAVVSYTNSTVLSSAGAAVSQAISGLVAANFQVTDQTGAILTPTTDYTVVESTTTLGTYTIDASDGAMTSGSVKVIPSSDCLFESNLATVTAA